MSIGQLFARSGRRLVIAWPLLLLSTGGYWKSAVEDKTAGIVFSWECDLLLLRSAFWPDIQGSSSRQASIFMHTFKAIYPIFKIKDFLVS